MTYPKSISVGALWMHQAKSGRKYLSGRVTVNGIEKKIAVFKNERKTEKKHPDYSIIAAEEESTTPAQGTALAAPALTSSQDYTRSASSSSPPGDNPEQEVRPEDIPF